MLPEVKPTTQPPTTPDWPPRGWIEKKVAAERLGLSPERISGMVREKTIAFSKAHNPHINQVVTLIDESEVARIRLERASMVVGTVDKSNKRDKPLALAAAAAKPEPEPAAALATRPWLTLDEAAAFSGLTKRWLAEIAEWNIDKENPVCFEIEIRDMGKHSPGGRWRFHRGSLEKE